MTFSWFSALRGRPAGPIKHPSLICKEALTFQVVVSDTPPDDAEEGDLYWDTGDARMFIYVTSTGVANWVPTTPVPDGGNGVIDIDGGIYAS